MTAATIDFDALRAKRNQAHRDFVENMTAEGWQVSPCSLRDEAACYCACSHGGPCEHNWTGPTVEIGEGGWSATCARCGIDAMGHDLRNDP